MDGSNIVLQELTKIKGIGYSVARAILRKADIPERLRVGLLSDAQIERLEGLIKSPDACLPIYMMNRRKDRETGQDTHLIGSDLTLQIRRDVEFEVKIKSWRGTRHKMGLKVRGQRTKTSGRKGVTMGVKKKKE
jgi:small subunit ribosomal protein S13